MPPYGSALRRGEWGSMKELRERDPSGGRLACPVSSRSAWVHSKTLSQKNQNTRKKDERFGKVFLSFSFLSFHSNPRGNYYWFLIWVFQFLKYCMHKQS